MSSDNRASEATSLEAERLRRPLYRNRIVRADNLTLLRTLDAECCDLIYADPPFNSNRAVGNTRQPALGFSDKHEGGLDGYLAFLRPRLVEMWRLLSRRGSLYVHLDWRTVHYVKVLLDELFGAEHFLNEIVWSYRSGGRTGRWFARKHDSILLYAKSPGAHTFNQLRGGTYRTLDLRMTPDGRPYKSTRNGPLHFHAEGPAVADVWDIPFLSTVSKERTHYPTQKPEALLERIVRASSNPEDVVADFFCGSGTTLAVAKRLGRQWLGCDISEDAAALAERRVAETDAPE